MLAKSIGRDDERLEAATAALAEVRPGMTLGLGTGRTAEHFVRLLGERVKAGLGITGVPTSERTAVLARKLGIPLTTLDAVTELDLTIDGADEFDSELRLIKGGGGALLREKIVAAASSRMIVVAEAAKKVDALGAFPLPIEVVSFGLGATQKAIETVASRLGLAPTMTLRNKDGTAFLTDGGHHILDTSFGRIPDPVALAAALHEIPGVVEHGLFIGLASAAAIGRGGSVEWLYP